ncbi:winged helix-turn-helix domain-containing protein [Micrococcoides hystricis]|uniref:Winged helix-turn-helix domain-containing protein n=1 Tax=Micrococcoides hystricis TaxID=1572761 RepID=A0ABV6PCB8_9MICC
MTSAAKDSHPRLKLVEPFMHPVRFSLMAALAGVEKLDFASTKEHLEVSDSVLSRQASQLEELGMVKISKGFVGKRPRTWFSLTKQGRDSWQQHLAALQSIAGT